MTTAPKSGLTQVTFEQFSHERVLARAIIVDLSAARIPGSPWVRVGTPGDGQPTVWRPALSQLYPSLTSAQLLESLATAAEVVWEECNDPVSCTGTRWYVYAEDPDATQPLS